MRNALLPYLRRIDETRLYNNFGPLVQAFEARFAANFSVVPAALTTLSSGTAALNLALRAAQATPGTLCLMPVWTFAASAGRHGHAGGAVRCADRL
jgi:dTDP-4-amino-4,6-dideoxygalactose transaminase